MTGSDSPDDWADQNSIAAEIHADLGRVPAPQLVDAKEAGRLLAVPHTWVLAEARAGRIPHVKLGRYVRFDPVQLEQWWRARQKGPEPEPEFRHRVPRPGCGCPTCRDWPDPNDPSLQRVR